MVGRGGLRPRSAKLAAPSSPASHAYFCYFVIKFICQPYLTAVGRSGFGCPGRGPAGILTPPPILLSLQEDQLGLSLLTLQQLQSEETLRRVREIAHQV